MTTRHKIPVCTDSDKLNYSMKCNTTTNLWENTAAGGLQVHLVTVRLGLTDQSTDRPIDRPINQPTKPAIQSKANKPTKPNET
jgi:hypothetical protein